jgi:ATP dependent DNA ligase-like protein
VHLPHFQPLPLSRARTLFSHPDWLFEIKWDGFRSLLYSDNDDVRLVSRNGNTFKSFTGLSKAFSRDIKHTGSKSIDEGKQGIHLAVQQFAEFLHLAPMPIRGETSGSAFHLSR